MPNWRDPAESPPAPLLESLRMAHAGGARVAGLCSGAFVLGQLDQALPVDVLARRAGMSRRNFDRRFREITGATPATWLTHQRVLRAQRLLESSTMAVEQVARQCGFSSAAALRPHFRRLVGVTPTAYRDAFGAVSENRRLLA